MPKSISYEQSFGHSIFSIDYSFQEAIVYKQFQK